MQIQVNEDKVIIALTSGWGNNHFAGLSLTLSVRSSFGKHTLDAWSSVLENIPYCLGALIFYYLLYQSKLVPRWLSGWGLLGAVLFLATVPFRMFDLVPPPTLVLVVPLILNELVLAIWLIVKGFNSSATTS